jgi:hypothetical protein
VEDLMKQKVKVYGRTRARQSLRKKRKGWGLFLYEVRWSLGVVVVCGVVVYAGLVWGDRK